MPQTPSSVRNRLRALELETASLLRALREQPDVELDGPHAVLEARGHAVLINAASVREVVRLVALDAVPSASAAVLGTFDYRAQTHFAVDLAALLTGTAPTRPALDAHMLVLSTAMPIALVAERVESVVTGLRVVAAQGEHPAATNGLVSLMVRAGARVLPLLDLHAVAARLGVATP